MQSYYMRTMKSGQTVKMHMLISVFVGGGAPCHKVHFLMLQLKSFLLQTNVSIRV